MAVSNLPADLVTRLQDVAKQGGMVSVAWCYEAADEIERLTRELEHTKGLADGRNVRIALIASERDQARHERDAAIEDVVRLAKALDDIECLAANNVTGCGTCTTVIAAVACAVAPRPAADVGDQHGG